MTAEQETEEEARPKRSWNSSTKLVQPRRAAATRAERRVRQEQAPRRRSRQNAEDEEDGQDQRHEESEQQTLTRELLERAVSTAFGGLLQDSVLDATAFPDVNASLASELSGILDKENTHPAQAPAVKIESKLRGTLEASASLSAIHRQRRRDQAQMLQQATANSRAAREFQRRMKHASFEHRERKMAVQALQARIHREIQFLTATAADLEKREFLLDEAFESYECALRLELGLDDNASSPHQQKRAETSSKPFY